MHYRIQPTAAEAAEFIEKYCVVGARFRELPGKLYEAYEDWCGRNYDEKIGRNQFGRMLTTRGFVIGPKIGGMRYRVGIKLKSHDGGSE